MFYLFIYTVTSGSGVRNCAPQAQIMQKEL